MTTGTMAPVGLPRLAPLRKDVLSVDLRVFYLRWLMAVQYELIAEDEIEPLLGVAASMGPLETLADYFGIVPDLVEAAAALTEDHTIVSKDELRKALAALPEHEKIELLLRVIDGDSYVGAELRTRLRRKKSAPATRRTAGYIANAGAGA